MSFITSAARMWLTRSLKPFIFSSDYDKTINYENTPNLGLYIHIPFCRSVCSFCPYCKEVYDKERLDKYIDALIGEIGLVTENKEKKQVTSLYFGGGTPALAYSRIGEIIAEVRMHFDVTDGIGLELHPADVTAEKLRVLKDAGVTRISIGIQSFCDGFLEVLGRDKFDYGKMFAALSEVSFETVSMDFIFALPGQTIDTVINDIETAFSGGANHIAVYPFIDFTFAERRFPKMPERKKKKLLANITAYCKEKGYVRDSIWTFAKPGTKKYSSMTRDNFLGFGCSATTLLADSFKINTFSVGAYIERIAAKLPATSLTCRFVGRQRMIYYLFWTAYTTRVSGGDFEKYFGKKLERCYGLELLAARVLGWIKKDGRDYTVTAKGAYYYHYFENYYTLSYIDKMWSLMRKEAFPDKLIIK